jgi:hypothetical protein
VGCHRLALADRMAMLGAQSKKNCVCVRQNRTSDAAEDASGITDKPPEK